MIMTVDNDDDDDDDYDDDDDDDDWLYLPIYNNSTYIFTKI